MKLIDNKSIGLKIFEVTRGNETDQLIRFYLMFSYNLP